MSRPRQLPPAALFHQEPQSQACPLHLSFFMFGCTEQHEGSFPLLGIGPAPPAVEARSLNCWTAREVPAACLFFFF